MTVYPFLGLFTSLAEDSPPGYASAMLNARVGDGKLRPRHGYRIVDPPPANYTAGYGFERLNGYDSVNANKEEWVSIESHSSGNAIPYSVDKTTGARTEIKNGVSSVSLQKSPWCGFSFRGDSYWVNPDATPSIAIHEIGDNTSWGTVSTLAAPGGLSAIRSHQYTASNFTSATATFSGAVSAVTLDSDGIHIEHTPSTTGAAMVEVDITTASAFATDWTYLDQMQVVAEEDTPGTFSGGWLGRYSAVTCTLINADGTPLEMASTESRHDLDNDDPDVSHWMFFWDAKTRANFDNIAKIRFEYTVNESSAATHKIHLSDILGGAIDFIYGGDEPAGPVKYGLTYYNSTTGIESDMAQRQLAATWFASARTDPYENERTRRTQITWEAAGSTGADKMRLYVEVDGIYYRVAEVADTPASIYWTWTRNEALASTNVWEGPTGGGAFATTTGIVNGFAFKGWVVWLYEGGFQNVKHSRVDNPLALASGTDTLDDVTRGATFSLADNFADEPVGGCQAGDAMMILGKEGVYTQAGDYPSQMTPPRKIPGSMGCAGKYAFQRFRSDSGEYGVAWLDLAGNVWFAGSSLAFASDAGAKPVELSAPIREYARSFLLEDQEDEFGFTSLSLAHMEADEATGALWILFGRRALVLRPPAILGGARQWEAYKYAFTASDDSGGGGGGGTESVETDWFAATGPATSVARSGSTDAFTELDQPFESDDLHAVSSPISPGDKTEELQVESLKTLHGIPEDATLTKVTVRVEHSCISAGGAGTQAIHDYCRLAESGTIVAEGTNKAASTLLTDEDVFEEFEFEGAELTGITPADINAGNLDIHLGYTAVPDAAFDLEEFAVSEGGTGEYEVNGVVTAWDTGPPFAAATGKVFTDPASARTEGAIEFDVVGPVDATYAILEVTTTCVGQVVRLESVGNPSAVYLNESDELGGSYSNPTDSAPDLDNTLVTTAKRRVDLVAGVGTLGIDVLSEGASLGPHVWGQVNVSVDGSAEPVDPDDSTIRVDSVSVKFQYTVVSSGGADEGVGVQFAAYSPLRKLWALRNSGSIDEMEWDSAQRVHIEGLGRDGGYEMPDGYWEGGEARGANRRLSHVGIDRIDPSESVSIVQYSDRADTAKDFAANVRHARFGVTQQGWNHRTRIIVRESDTGVERLDLDFVALSSAYRR